MKGFNCKMKLKTLFLVIIILFLIIMNYMGLRSKSPIINGMATVSIIIDIIAVKLYLKESRNK